MIDYIIVNSRWQSSVTSCRSFPSADVGSDHQLVMAGIRLKLRMTRKKKAVQRFNVAKLEDGKVASAYRETMRKKFVEATRTGVEDLWKTIKTIYIEAAEHHLEYRERQTTHRWISDEVLLLSDKRKEMKASRYVDDESRKTYNYLTREIKRVARKRKEQWIIDK